MNKEINQTCQKIDYEDILGKKFYPVWFFTNERVGSFVQKLGVQKQIERVFSIGGGGDFVLSLLSESALKQVKEVHVCDVRQMANISIDFKLGIFKNLEYEEALNQLQRKETSNKMQVYRKIRETITPLSRKIFDSILSDDKEDRLLDCLRKSGLWYRDSFWQIKNKADYLCYLASKERYDLMRKGLDKISIHSGDFNDNLRLFKDGYFDLVYVSNILDSQDYCREVDQYLQTIKEKLSGDGSLFVITQNNPKKVTRLVEKHGFRIDRKELPEFRLFSSLFRHYLYSLLLFGKNE